MSNQENNKMIAEFMGLELEETLEGLFVYARKEQSPIKLNDIRTEFYEVHELQYHISWDWLMPVVEKINNILDDDDEFVYSVNIHPSKVTIYYENYDRIFVSNEHGSTTREMLYLAVVKFIKKYNKNK